MALVLFMPMLLFMSFKWDLSELECYLIEHYDVVFKAHASYYNLLKEAKISWQKAQPKNPRQDPDFLKKLIRKNPHKKIIIFWDGASYHRGEEMQNFLAEINHNLESEEWKITCEMFAPYAPEENPIEAIWLSLKNLLRRCYRFCKNFRIIKQIFKLLIDFKLFNFPNLQTYDAFSCLI